MNLDKHQKAFCKSDAERIRLLAPAGSGKTLSLLWRCAEIQKASEKKPQRFLVVTFTRSARDELRARIKNDPDLQFLGSHLQINTLNALGFRHLRSQQTGLKLVTRKDAYNLIDTILRPVWSKNTAMEPLLSNRSNLNALKSDILDAFDVLKELGFRHNTKNQRSSFREHTAWLETVGLGRYFRTAYHEKLQKMKLHSEEEQYQFLAFWAAATEHLYQSNLITFTDQKYGAMLRLEGSSVAANQRFHHILVDEFQDVDPLDMNLIKVLVSIHKSTLTIVGDDDQAIFEWRGAVPKFILEPESFLGGNFESHVLGNNYRSPENIVRHAQKLIRNNTIRVMKDVNAKNTKKAEIECREFTDYKDSCAFVMGLVKEMHENKEGNKLAIVGRKRGQIIPYQILLAAEGIRFYAKEDLNVFLQVSFDTLRETLIALARRNDRQRRSPEVVDDFMLLVDKIKRFPLNKADKPALKAHLASLKPRTLGDALDALSSYDGTLKGGIGLHLFYNPISLLLKTTTPAETLAILGEHFEGFRKDYGKAQSLEDIFYIDPPFLHLADYAQRYGDDYNAFLDDLDEAISYLQTEPTADTEEDSDVEESLPIHLMTALRAKGKEYHTVVVLDAIDGIWPSKLASTPTELEQERRLFYVAVTRPRTRLFIIANSTILGEPTSLSPYIHEMRLPPKSNPT